MSDYRVFDKTKNQYDATVMSNLFVDDTPKGFDVAISLDNLTNISTNGTVYYSNDETTVIFTSFRQNPAGGNYEWNDFTLPSTTGGFNTSGNTIIRAYCVLKSSSDAGKVFPVKLRFKNETNFKIRVYNFPNFDFPADGTTVTGEGGFLGQPSAILHYKEGYTPDILSNSDFELEGNSEKVFEIRIYFSNASFSFGGEIYYPFEISLPSFSIQRIF